MNVSALHAAQALPSRAWWAVSWRQSLGLLSVAGGFAILIAFGAVAEARWERYPVKTFVAQAYDPSELLRGAYVDLRTIVANGQRPELGEGQRVRFLAAEDEARIIEGAIRGQRVTLEARVAPDGQLKPLAVITPDGRRFATR